MAPKSGSRKKSGDTRSGDARERDRLIDELKERVAVLENESRLKQGDITFRESSDLKPMGEYLVLFQRMVDKSADMVFLLGLLGRILYANEAACKALGYTREELQSMTVFDINQMHHEDNWLEHEEELKKQGSMTFENVLRTKDGGLIPVEVSANYSRLGDEEYNYSFIRDITERKQAEAALRESEASRKVAEAVEAERRRLFDVLETLPAMVCLLTPDHHVAFANRSFRKKFGESHGRHCYDYCFGRPEPCDFCESYKVLETDEPHHWEVTGPDGSTIDVYDFPFTDVDGTPMILEMDIDITERRRAEEALRKNEEMLRRIIDTSPVPMVLYNEEEKIYLYNKKFTETFGYTIRDVPTINEWWALAYPDEKYREIVKKKWYDAVDYAVKNKTSIASQEAVVTIKDGSKRYILGELSSIGSMNLAVFYDITDRKRAEEALSESEEKFRVLAETSPAAIFLYQGEKYVYVNPMAETLTGYSGNELLTGVAWEWIHPEYKELVKRRARKRQLGEQLPNQYEVMYRAKDGREGWVDFAAGLVEYGGKPAGLAMAFDVSKRKQTEEALRFERAQLLSIFDSIDEVVYVADPDTHEVLYANRAMQDRFGKPIIGGLCYREIQNKDAPCEFCTNDIILEKKGEPYRWEFHNPIVNRDFDIVDRIIKWPDGRDVRFEIAIDITERKRTEEELKAAKAQAELYVDLMGHDINNIHQAALGYLEMAKDMPGDSRDEYMDKAMEALNRSTLLINNVRKLQKLKDGRMQFRDVDVCAVLSEVHREYALTPGKNIILDLHCHAHCLVKANDLLHDVFSNLVGNAVKHTGNNTNVSIGLGVVREDGVEYYRVSIDDDGLGIPDDFKANIFNRMLKGTNKARGMGLGLYIVKTLVEYYCGRVWVEDRVKGDHTKGARFVVMLPAVEK